MHRNFYVQAKQTISFFQFIAVFVYNFMELLLQIHTNICHM